MKRSIVLCGFMGCGKTTVGKELASLCGCPFFDCDLYVEEQQNMKTAEIFDRFGEDKFRQLEHEAIAELVNKQPSVISLGGGAIMFKRNVELLKDVTTVFIDTPFVLIEERLRDDDTRPLARDKEKLSALYTKRYPFYKSASQIVLTADKDPQTTAQEILKILNSEEK